MPWLCQEAYMLWWKWHFYQESTKYQNLFSRKIFLFCVKIFLAIKSEPLSLSSTLAEFVKWELDPAANNFLGLPAQFIYKILLPAQFIYL